MLVLLGKKVGAHTLRHSGASLVARKTQSALVVKALLQHDKIETSMLYIHDAEDEIQQAVSPMAMINVRPVEQPVLRITDGKTKVVEGELVGNVVETIDLTEEMFEKIPDGIKIRPLLGNRELLLFRSIAIEFSRGNKGDSRVYEAQALLKRMLRKVG